jgi:hypothetical protein
MTGLFIDRQPVVLPKDFSFEIIAENPFLPKTGHTLLNLRCPCQIRRTPKYTGITTGRTVGRKLRPTGRRS